MQELLTELKKAYKAAGLNCGEGLLPPAARNEIDAISDGLKLVLPDDLILIYQIYGGQEYITPGVTGLFGRHRLHTPSEITQHHQLFCECFSQPIFKLMPESNGEWNWAPQLIPFASWDKYDLCVDSASGEIWEFCPNSGLLKINSSVANVLKRLLAKAQLGKEPKFGWFED